MATTESLSSDNLKMASNVDNSKPISDPSLNDINGNAIENSIENSIESGYFASESDGDSRATGSASGSLSSLAGLGQDVEVSAPTPAEPTEEEKKAWLGELAKIDEETATLRLVLQAKIRRATDLKRKLGITQVDEIKAEVNSALKNIQESNAYVKTSATLQVVSQKTGQIVSNAASAFRESISGKNNNNNDNIDESSPGREKVGNAIFRDASGKISSAVSVTGTYVSQTVDSVKSSPPVQAVGAGVSATWAKLKEKVVGGEKPNANDSFLGDVVDN